jgi:hypothetical protein
MHHQTAPLSENLGTVDTLPLFLLVGADVDERDFHFDAQYYCGSCQLVGLMHGEQGANGDHLQLGGLARQADLLNGTSSRLGGGLEDWPCKRAPWNELMASKAVPYDGSKLCCFNNWENSDGFVHLWKNKFRGVQKRRRQEQIFKHLCHTSDSQFAHYPTRRILNSPVCYHPGSIVIAEATTCQGADVE